VPFEAWEFGARSILGGLTGAYVGVLVAKRLIGYRVRTGDLFAPAVAVGWIGCLLTEAPGRPTALPWGIHALASVPGCVAGVAMHPSFAYEIVFPLAAFAALCWLRPRVHRPGALFCRAHPARRNGAACPASRGRRFSPRCSGSWCSAAAVRESLLGLRTLLTAASSALPGRRRALRRLLGERVVWITVKPFMDIATMLEERLLQCCGHVVTRGDAGALSESCQIAVVVRSEVEKGLFRALPESDPCSLVPAEQDSTRNHPELQPQRCTVHDEQIHIVTIERGCKLIVQTGFVEQITARA
jgi:prolipoprotein diacylglyceryl transferase